MAAWLGLRYGRAGLAVAALGGLFLIIGVRGSAGGWGGNLDLYLLGLLAAWIATSGTSLDDVADVWAEPWMLFLSVLILPVSVFLFRRSIDTAMLGEITISVSGSLLALFHVAMFLAGLSLVRARPVLILLLVATVLGLAGMAYVDAVGTSPPPGSSPPPSLRYGLSRPVALLLAVTCFATGRLMRDFGGGRAPNDLGVAGRMFVVVLLLAIWGGGGANLALRAVLPPPALPISSLGLEIPPDTALVMAAALDRLGDWLGHSHALALAAFMAGLLLGYGGIVFVAAMAVGMFVLNALAFGFRDPTTYDPLPLLGFGVLGVEVAAARWGRSPVRRFDVWARLLGTALMVAGVALVIADNLPPLAESWTVLRKAVATLSSGDPPIGLVILAALVALYAILAAAAFLTVLWSVARRVARDIAALRAGA